MLYFNKLYFFKNKKDKILKQLFESKMRKSADLSNEILCFFIARFENFKLVTCYRFSCILLKIRNFSRGAWQVSKKRVHCNYTELQKLTL